MVKTWLNLFINSGLLINTSKAKTLKVGSKKYADIILCSDLTGPWSNSNLKLFGIAFSSVVYCKT